MDQRVMSPKFCQEGNNVISNLLYLSTPELDEELHRLFCVHNSDNDKANPIHKPAACRSLFNGRPIFQQELATNACPLTEIMQEFQENGVDYEYCPQDEVDNVSVVFRSPCKNTPIASSIFNRAKPKRRIKKVTSSSKYCVFCKNNEQPPEVYLGHIFRNENNVVVCPYLRKYVCPLCHASGDNAHTRKYCPKSGTSWSRAGSSSSESSI